MGKDHKLLQKVKLFMPMWAKMLQLIPDCESPPTPGPPTPFPGPFQLSQEPNILTEIVGKSASDMVC